MAGAGNSGCPGTVYDDFNPFDLFVDDFQRIQQRSSQNDGRTVLVVMENRNTQHLLEALFDFKTFRCFDIFQIDSPKSISDGCYRINKPFFIRCIDFDVKNIYIGEFLEQNTLAFHHRFGS